ncbi:MAG: hypothetical protein U5L96_07690 [Owenweeksia sp.]|nr:hypothetical protein [Owenweeksia sp.]
MNKFSGACLLLIFSLTAVLGQSNKSKRLFNKARQAIAEKSYQDARKDLARAIEDSPNYIDALLLKADVHKKLGEDSLSLPLYKQALEHGAPYYVYLFYGQMLFNTGHYQEAIDPLEAYSQHPRANGKYLAEARAMLSSASYAAQATQNPVDYNPQNLGSKVNTSFMEYFPSISADGNSLVFTHRKTEGDETDEDFWITHRDTTTGEWSQAEPLQGFLDARLNEGAQALTSNGRIIYFAACERPDGQGSCDIYASFYRGQDQWSKPVNLGPTVNTSLWESQPSISSDGRVLYFC